MTHRPNSLLLGLVTCCAVIVGCATNPTERMTLSTTTTPKTTTPAATIDSTSSVASSPPPSTDRPDMATMVTDTDTGTDTNTNTSTGADTSTGTATETNTGTDTNTGSGTGTDTSTDTDTSTESQVSSAAPSEAIAADLAGIDELGMCDGSWVSDLDETNSDRPPDVDALTESWRCQFGNFDTQVLRWADAAQTRTNLLALKRLTEDAGADPALWQFVLKDDHIIGVSPSDDGSDAESEMLNQIQAKIGGEAINLSQYN